MEEDIKMTKRTSKKRSRGTGAGSSCPSCTGSHACGRKGQGISINTIIIAVLGLIVLVVLIVIFTGQTGKFTKGTAETASVTCPGAWLETCADPTPNPFYGVTDAAQLRNNAGKTCCVPLTVPPAKK